jgi:hypothetical protein
MSSKSILFNFAHLAGIDVDLLLTQIYYYIESETIFLCISLNIHYIKNFLVESVDLNEMYTLYIIYQVLLC